jgi:hypothetical protein
MMKLLEDWKYSPAQNAYYTKGQYNLVWDEKLEVYYLYNRGFFMATYRTIEEVFIDYPFLHQAPDKFDPCEHPCEHPDHKNKDNN